MAIPLYLYTYRREVLAQLSVESAIYPLQKVLCAKSRKEG